MSVKYELKSGKKGVSKIYIGHIEGVLEKQSYCRLFHAYIHVDRLKDSYRYGENFSNFSEEASRLEESPAV